MAERDKKDLIEFGKAVGIFVICGALIITTAGVWNAVAKDAISSFYGWVAGVNAGVSIIGIMKLIKTWFPRQDKKSKE